MQMDSWSSSHSQENPTILPSTMASQPLKLPDDSQMKLRNGQVIRVEKSPE